MARADADSWDLASSVGCDRDDGRRGAGAGQPGRRPADRRPVRRAAGARGRHRLLHQGWSTARSRSATPTSRRCAQLMTDVMAVRTRFFDDFFLDAAAARAFGRRSSWRRAWTRAPTGCRGRTARPCLRDRPAAGHRVQDRDDDRRSAPRPPRDRRAVAVDLRDDWPAALRAQRVRRDQPDGVERRGPAGLPAARRPGPAVRRHHRAVGAGQQAGHRVPPGRRRQRSASGRRAMQRAVVASTASTSNLADLFYPGERNPVVDYLHRARLAGERPDPARGVRRLRPHVRHRRCARADA